MANTMATSPTEYRLAKRYIPTGSTAIEHRLGVCYVADGDTKTRAAFSVIAYRGSAGKSSFYESFRTAEVRDKRVAEFFSNLEEHEQRLEARRAERSKPHTLKVGDIITNSWGYDQTNVDMYQIVKATANYVWLQPIAGEMVPSEGLSSMAGMVRPELPIRQILTREVREYGNWEPGIGNRVVSRKQVPLEPTKHKAEGNNVHFEHGCGSKWEGRALYCSWYA